MQKNFVPDGIKAKLWEMCLENQAGPAWFATKHNRLQGSTSGCLLCNWVRMLDPAESILPQAGNKGS